MTTTEIDLSVLVSRFMSRARPWGRALRPGATDRRTAKQTGGTKAPSRTTMVQVPCPCPARDGPDVRARVRRSGGSARAPRPVVASANDAPTLRIRPASASPPASLFAAGRCLDHSAASDPLLSSNGPIETQEQSSRREAVSLDDRGHSGPPGPHRRRLPDARPGPALRRTLSRRRRTPAPCHEGSCPRSLRRSRGRRLHRSRPGYVGRRRVRLR